MSSTIALAKKKYVRKVTGKAWKKGMGLATKTDFKTGVADFLDVEPEDIADIPTDNWKTGVDGVTEEDFDTAVSGKEDKMITNYKKKMLKHPKE